MCKTLTNSSMNVSQTLSLMVTDESKQMDEFVALSSLSGTKI